MGALFSKKERSLQHKVTDEDRAVLALKMQRDKMKMAYKRHENDIIKQKDMARLLLKEGRKDRALILLKRKKYQETLMDQILGQLDHVERIVHQIEGAQLNKEVFERLKHGNDALQALNEQFSIDDAERIMEETKEAADMQEEISEILSTKLTSEDLEAVEEEFNEIIREQLPEAPSELPEPVHNEAESKKKEKALSRQKHERVALPAL